jgi:hypothetical protein
MNINNHPQTNELYTQNTKGAEARKPTLSSTEVDAEVKPSGEKLDLSKLDALRNQPEIRPEVVARGKELLNDPNYPSKEIVDSIAKLIVPFDDGE